MGHSKKHSHYHHKDPRSSPLVPSQKSKGPVPHNIRLEVVLKSDSSGTLEAVTAALQTSPLNDIPLVIFHRGIGPVNKTDILNAETGSRLVLGFNVDVLPHIEELCRQHNVEVRLYDVIYRMTSDLTALSASLTAKETKEQITGSAKIIALFKSSRHGIILGCEVQRGRIKLGDRFRVITAMGTVYAGTIESLHIEKEIVKQASAGQQVGLKIRDFNKAHLGDLVECFTLERDRYQPWKPRGRIIRP
jgi:translation initiation factor IF-2